MTKLAVLGSPIGHSKSPALHAAAYRVLGLDWEYGAVDVDEARLPGFLDALDAEWRGLSLTMPLKQVVVPLLRGVDRIGELTGAVNTVLVQERLGFNTDVPGIVRALDGAGIRALRRVHILGGGATAGSVIVAAAELGAESVLVSVREPLRAAALEPLAASVGLMATVQPFSAPRDDDATDLLVSALPGGVVAPIDFDDGYRARVPLFDVAYDPWPSAAAQAWLSVGGAVVPGIDMLLHQALLQVRVFVGGDPFAELPDEPAVFAAMAAAVGRA